MTKRTVIGFDLGGTKSAIGLFDADTWKQLSFEKFPTDAAQGFQSVLRQCMKAIEQLRRPDTVGLGMGLPGLVRQPEGQLVHAPNLPGGHHVLVQKELEDALGLPVAVDNDAHAFTLAEAVLGAGKGQKVVVGITMGTGVGGGIVIDGKIFHGSEGFAAEIGHMLLMPGRPPFEGENIRGDVEQFLSGTALGRRCDEARKPEEYLMGEVCEFLHPEIFREVSWLCTSLTHLLNPSMIIFGGSAGKALKPHLEVIEQELLTWLLPYTPLPKLAVSELPHPGTLGAALLTRT